MKALSEGHLVPEILRSVNKLSLAIYPLLYPLYLLNTRFNTRNISGFYQITPEKIGYNYMKVLS